MDKCLRENKIAPFHHACLVSLGTCAEGVQFYCSSHTYAAIPFCNIFPFLEHSDAAEWRGPISHFKTWFWLNDFELKSAAVCAHYFDCSNFKIILFYISACNLHSEQNLFQKRKIVYFCLLYGSELLHYKHCVVFKFYTFGNVRKSQKCRI